MRRSQRSYDLTQTMESTSRPRFKKIKFAKTGENMNEWFEKYRYIQICM
jgi:hypothetical protein